MLIQGSRPRCALSRRAALRGGLSTLIALPFLEAMAPSSARAQAVDPVKRFLAFYLPNGLWMPSFTPSTTGPLDAAALPLLLEPLAPIASRVSVVSGLHNVAVDNGSDPAGPHARGTASFLTGASVLASESTLRNGVSVDQRIADAQAAAGFRGLRSLELGCERGGALGTCDAGYSCAYQVNIAWSGAQSPLPKETNPRAVFDRLFTAAEIVGTPEDRARQRRARHSILDVVRGDATRLHARLGHGDRQKLDEHLTGLRELERRIDDDGVLPDSCVTGDVPVDVDIDAAAVDAAFDVTAYVRTMLDLAVASFACDRTRVVTFMLGNGGSPRSYGFLGVDGQHHGISHRPRLFEQLQQINRWEIEQVAYLIDKLANVADGDGVSVLDNSFVYAASELSDGATHDRNNLPIILAGGAAGLSHGAHQQAGDRPVADLLLTALRSCGVRTPSFADSTGSLHF